MLPAWSRHGYEITNQGASLGLPPWVEPRKDHYAKPAHPIKLARETILKHSPLVSEFCYSVTYLPWKSTEAVVQYDMNCPFGLHMAPFVWEDQGYRGGHSASQCLHTSQNATATKGRMTGEICRSRLVGGLLKIVVVGKVNPYKLSRSTKSHSPDSSTRYRQRSKLNRTQYEGPDYPSSILRHQGSCFMGYVPNSQNIRIVLAVRIHRCLMILSLDVSSESQSEVCGEAMIAPFTSSTSARSGRLKIASIVAVPELSGGHWPDRQDLYRKKKKATRDSRRALCRLQRLRVLGNKKKGGAASWVCHAGQERVGGKRPLANHDKFSEDPVKNAGGWLLHLGEVRETEQPEGAPIACIHTHLELSRAMSLVWTPLRSRLRKLSRYLAVVFGAVAKGSGRTAEKWGLRWSRDGSIPIATVGGMARLRLA
ncbi:uncharacterized protein BO96DRAFT_396873 [Aspergillus niger CBS 101883]|uniref:uncharacterized protein n=1 Tax=Aspergillus lacticoffeatus (strain CBS 101883) TaxID=1450533 RepID=UPI000D7EBC73|nr:uncharacterized protein BO96DRAFT_396873 [Aspergillus niger CBS 101883]PYH54930.1 hypothetical protein BO96DRAFT_396873 [Aspergillus niger CBS 101883]